MERQEGQLTDLQHSNENFMKRTGELQQGTNQLHFKRPTTSLRKELELKSGKRLPKRSSIISDMPSIGAGGITSITPLTFLNISKRLKHSFEPRL
jgi:hypothetical protein